VNSVCISLGKAVCEQISLSLFGLYSELKQMGSIVFSLYSEFYVCIQSVF
jgi:hypothetical protein